MSSASRSLALHFPGLAPVGANEISAALSPFCKVEELKKRVAELEEQLQYAEESNGELEELNTKLEAHAVVAGERIAELEALGGDQSQRQAEELGRAGQQLRAASEEVQRLRQAARDEQDAMGLLRRDCEALEEQNRQLREANTRRDTGFPTCSASLCAIAPASPTSGGVCYALCYVCI